MSKILMILSFFTLGFASDSGNRIDYEKFRDLKASIIEEVSEVKIPLSVFKSMLKVDGEQESLVTINTCDNKRIISLWVGDKFIYFEIRGGGSKEMVHRGEVVNSPRDTLVGIINGATGAILFSSAQ